MTPGRKTLLELNIPEVVLGRTTWSIERRARHMRPQTEKFGLKTERVFSVGGEAWILAPRFAESIQTVSADLAALNVFIDETVAQLAAGYASAKHFRRNDDLSGAAGPKPTIASGGSTIRKVVTGDDPLWDNAVLAEDTLSLPPPPDETEQLYPLDRAVAGLETYPECTPWMLKLSLPKEFWGIDGFFNFYFGGEAQVLPQDASGGHFCLQVRGGGQAILWERDERAGEWRKRFSFAWGHPHQGMNEFFLVSIIPFGRDSLAFAVPAGSSFSLGGLEGHTSHGFGLYAPPALSMHFSKAQHVYRDTLSGSGHKHVFSATGRGIIRADFNRVYGRYPAGIVRGIYPMDTAPVPEGGTPAGVLVDAPFPVTTDISAGTPLTLTPDTHCLPGTAVYGQLYDATTGAPLTQNGDGTFAANAGQRYYYAAFFFSSADGLATPVLSGYTVSAPGVFIERTPVSTWCDAVSRVDSVTLGDLEPDHELAEVQVRDLRDRFSMFRKRDAIRCRLAVTDAESGSLISYLFEGDTCEPAGQWRGSREPGDPYPDWHDYELRIVGLWGRCREQFHKDAPVSFASSQTSPNPAQDASGAWLPWQITDVLRWLLNNAGIPDDELDLPNLSLRLWPTEPNSSDVLAVQPGTVYADLAQDLGWKFLEMALVRDPNAGARGMWRLLANPDPSSTNFVAGFYVTEPAIYGAAPITHPGVYPAGTTYVKEWREHPQRPEGNEVTVHGINPNGSSDDGSNRIDSQLINDASITGSDDGLDFLGRTVPIVRGLDPAVYSQDMADWLCYRIFNLAAHGRSWFQFRAPLLFVVDPTDPLQRLPRPPRFLDQILLYADGAVYSGLVRSVRPNYEHDELQWMDVEGIFWP